MLLQSTGVTQTAAGYMGGRAPAGQPPTYGNYAGLGFTETVKVQWDPAITSYHDLLEVYFASQPPWAYGADTHTSRHTDEIAYRRTIFVFTASQEAMARASLEAHDRALQARSGCASCTNGVQIVRASAENYNGVRLVVRRGEPVPPPTRDLRFFLAEEQHQNWYRKGGETCRGHSYIGTVGARPRTTTRPRLPLIPCVDATCGHCTLPFAAVDRSTDTRQSGSRAGQGPWALRFYIV